MPKRGFLAYTLLFMEKRMSTHTYMTDEERPSMEITVIILQLPNHCLKKDYKMGAYINSLLVKGHMELQN